jgi:hypothetical protein
VRDGSFIKKLQNEVKSAVPRSDGDEAPRLLQAEIAREGGGGWYDAI